MLEIERLAVCRVCLGEEILKSKMCFYAVERRGESQLDARTAIAMTSERGELKVDNCIPAVTRQFTLPTKSSNKKPS